MGMGSIGPEGGSLGGILGRGASISLWARRCGNIRFFATVNEREDERMRG